MNHLFVPYELAIKLKEKGFTEPCLSYYQPNIEGLVNQFYVSVDQPEVYEDTEHIITLAPLYQQVVDWFRDKKSKFIYIQCILIHLPEGGYFWGIGNMKIEDGWEHTNYDMEEALRTHKSYYKCLETAIEEALKLI